MTVEDGRIALPGGMRYRVLVLPPEDRMTLPAVEESRIAGKAGATVYGPKPLHSPSLAEVPDADLERIAAEVWGNCDGKTVTEHPYGKGKIVWGAPLGEGAASRARFLFCPG